MIFPHNFHTDIQYDEDGVLVVITHKPTGMQRTGRPTPIESVGKVEKKLLEGLKAEFYDPNEFNLIHYCGRTDGQRTSSTSVVHIPTGKHRGPIEHGLSPRSTVLRLTDEIVAELWEEKQSGKSKED